MSHNKVIGIDIGATKIHMGLVQDGQILAETKFSTAAQAPQEQIISDIAAGIEALITPDVAGIGIGVPGLVDEVNGLVYDLVNIPSWQQVPLKAALQGYFKKPVFITNDGNTFALGEKLYGQGQEYNNLLGITLGTGLGTGMVLNGQLYSGMLSSAGEFGSVPYLDKTLEDYCSGKFFVHRMQLPGTQVFALAQAGERAALQAFAEYGTHLAHALKIMLFAVSPEAIFLGGSISGCYDLFKASLEAGLAEFPFKRVLNQLTIKPSVLSQAGVLGAAALVEMQGITAAHQEPVLAE